ncbi:hypothetical protein [Qipengyuania algicida]|jgi:hypothetical protein|nr:hypothetical protein [Qipengyuania algicida]
MLDDSSLALLPVAKKAHLLFGDYPVIARTEIGTPKMPDYETNSI